MADFKTHITASTIVGVAYGYWGIRDQGMSIESGLLAGGLCSVAGMLPDLDSDSGVPLRETSMFASAIIPMLMIERWRDMGLSHESMALAAMLIYIAIRFVAVEFFRRFTVHRGMWHSIPAAVSAGMLAYLVMPCPSEAVRVYKSLAVFVGFMVHLILDEIWSLDFSRGRFRVKNSFGTALKFFGTKFWPNVSVYAKLAFLCYLAYSDHAILDRLRARVRLDRERYAEPAPASNFFPAWQGNPTSTSHSPAPYGSTSIPPQDRMAWPGRQRQL
ncbi:MAG: metal-dependent hydrolase [Planctomycetota bacterium]